MGLKDKLIVYTYHKVNELEQEQEELKRILRRQPIDGFDLYEIMRENIRIEAWKEFISDLYKILINCK